MSGPSSTDGNRTPILRGDQTHLVTNLFHDRPLPLFRDTYRRLQAAHWRWRHRGERPVLLVHQMARVGSRSVMQALRDRFPERHVLHTHYLDPETVAGKKAQFDRYHRETGYPGLYRAYRTAELVRGWREQRGWGDWHVISLVRDPVARNVSAFFRHLPLNHPQLGVDFRNDPANVGRLIDLFLEPSEPEHQFALDWFDREVRTVLAVDVFAVPFGHDRGHQTYRSEAGPLLLIRLEDLSSVGPAALGEFLGVEPLPIPTINRTDNLDYAGTYARFIEELTLPADYLDRMYESRLARHFYRDHEIQAFRERWSGG